MDKVLSYHDVLLRQQDLELLEDGQWLNDQVLAFFFEYLAKEVHPSLQGALLVTGATAFLILHSQGAEVACLVNALQVPGKQLVLLAVNDNPYIEQAGGGSHWSLLAYSAHDSTFRHYDSAQGSNRRPARQLAGKLSGALGLSHCNFVEVDSPQQRNSYDCGVYVLAIARLLCQQFAQHGQGMSYEVRDISSGSVSALRAEVRSIIASKAAAQRAEQLI